MKRTHEEELCGMLKDGRCVAGQELEKARQVIRELREQREDAGKAFEEEIRALRQCEKDRVKGDEEIARLDAEIEKQSRIVKSVAAMLGWENVPPQETLERDLSAMKARMALSEGEIGKLREWRSSERQTWAEETAALEKRVDEAEARGVPDERGCQAAREEAKELRADVAGLQEEKTDREKAWAEETRALEQCEKDRVKADEEIVRLDAALEKARADSDGLELELHALRSAKRWDADLFREERDEANKSLAECRRVWQGFINDCAALLGLPKLEGCLKYGGGAIRKGITRLHGALEKIDGIRNDVIGRQHMGWSAHIYPLVVALNEAGFKGAGYDKAREKVEATMRSAREMVVRAWCMEKTAGTVMDVDLAEEFAEILFPFLEALEFYGLLGNWQGSKADAHESACDRDLGSRARAAMGRPDRDVPEIIENGDEEKTCANCRNCEIDEVTAGPAELTPPMPYRMHCSERVFASCGETGSFENWIDDGESPVSRACGRPCSSPKCTKDAEWVIVSGPTMDDCWEACTAHVGELFPDAQELRVYPVDQGKANEHSGTGGGPSGDGS